MKIDTISVHGGRDTRRDSGAINPPVDRTSTRIFDNLDALDDATRTGRLSAFLGSSTPEHVAVAVAELEGAGCRAMLTTSGMSALAITLLSVLSTGDHVLMPDSVFGPTRNMATRLLIRMGIAVDYYHPLASAEEFRAALRPNTRLVLTESPGSNTFEVQDIPMIVREAHAVGALVAIDNSWATPVLFRPLDHGVDISICAATKYLVGHADAIIGTIAARPDLLAELQQTAQQLGDTVAPDTAWLLARGIRTLPLRLRQHDASTRQIVGAIEGHPVVREILHPAQPDAVGHRFWQRDFAGASGLFGIVVPQLERPALEDLLARLRYFKLGFSWGGYESLILPVANDPARRLLTPKDGTILRLHVGLEDADDLCAEVIEMLDQISGLLPATRYAAG